MPSSSTIDPDHGVAAAAAEPSRPRTGSRHGRPEDFSSFLRTQDKIDAICKEHGVPKEYTALPAGDLRANSTPPRGAICVLARALEAGMRVPLHGFFSEALAHFGIAPAQLTPNGWRIMAGFLVLCRSVGVPPSLSVFRRFFMLGIVSRRQKKGWYFFQSRDSSGLRFTGMPDPNWVSFRYWKHEFFFLSSPEPWPCTVEWAERSKSSLINPVLTVEEKKWAAKLLRAHGGAAVDLRKYLSKSNLAAAMITTALPPSPWPPSTCFVSKPEGLDPSVCTMMKTMLAEKAATLKKVKAEPNSDAPGSRPSYGKKRSLQEADGEEEPLLSLLNMPLSGVRSPPPGFAPKHQNISSRLDRHTTVREPARELAKAKAELAVTGAELAKAKTGLAMAEAEVVKAKAELTAAKRAADAAEQGKARPEVAMEGADVAKAVAKLAVAKRALEEELDSAKVAAVQQLLCCEEHVRRRAEHALEGYQRWRKKRSCCWLVSGEQIFA